MTYTPLQMNDTWRDRVSDSRLAVWLRKYMLCVSAGLCLAGLAI